MELSRGYLLVLEEQERVFEVCPLTRLSRGPGPHHRYKPAEYRNGLIR